MKLPTWFRITWWLVITALTLWLFITRIPSINNSGGAPVDIFIFLVLVALLLVPIFQEVSFFGLKFKQAIDDLQKQISTQLSVLKADIQTSISNTSNVNVTIPQPPSDDQLPDLERKIRESIADAFEDHGYPEPTPTPTPTPIPEIEDNTAFLFQTRYNIEKRLRNIARSLGYDHDGRHMPITKISNILVKEELLTYELSKAIKQIYSVCSPAIHGEEVTEAQVNFVRDIVPAVMEFLDELDYRVG